MPGKSGTIKHDRKKINVKENLKHQECLEQLYQGSYGAIIDLALSDKRLLPQDGERIAQSIAAHLDSYDGLLEPEPFQAWASEIAKPAVARLSRFLEIREQHDKTVLKAVWSVVGGATDLSDYDNPTRTARDLADEVWLWVFENLEDIDNEGQAKLSTRLYSKARWLARAWKTSRLRRRGRLKALDDGFNRRCGYIDGEDDE